MLVRLLGPDVFGDVLGVELHVDQVLVGRDPTVPVVPDPAEERAAVQAKADALMARVGQLGRLRWLSVAGLPMTDTGMDYLKRLPRLETLKLVSLAGTTGKGFRSVGSLKSRGRSRSKRCRSPTTTSRSSAT